MMNMILRKKFYFSLAIAATLGLTSCSDDDTPNTSGGDGVGTGSPEQYVIAATSEENSYLLTTDDISQGQVSIVGDGLQVVGTPSWYFYNELAAYSFVYRQGDPGTTQSFILNQEGELEGRNEIDLQVSIQSRGIVGDEMFVQFSSRNYEEPVATFYKINGETQAVSGPFSIDTEALADNGEYAYITDIAEYNNQVLVGYRTIKAGEDGSDSAFNSDFNDHTFIAVFNQDLELQERIEDSGRTGVVAGQQRSQGETGIEPVENGDVYVFSSAIDTDGEVPSGVLRINDGTMEFDQDYFFNITEASGGYNLYRTYYVGENTFVLRMFSEQGEASATPNVSRNRFAVVNVEDQTFDWVEAGVPSEIAGIGEPFIDAAANEVVFPIETNGNPQLYILNADNATMSAGTEVEAVSISAIGRLSNE